MENIKPERTTVRINEMPLHEVCEGFFSTKYYKDDLWREDTLQSRFECYLNEDVKCYLNDWDFAYQYFIQTYLAAKIQFLKNEVTELEEILKGELSK